MKLEDHPTVQRIHLKTVPSVPSKKESLDARWLKQLVLDAGADDVGFVKIDRRPLMTIGLLAGWLMVALMAGGCSKPPEDPRLRIL